MSKKLQTPLRILIIDDDTKYARDLQRDANPHRIILEHVTNLEEACQSIKSKGKRFFDGIILDVICLEDKKQQNPDRSFITKAKEVLDRTAGGIPKVILTGETNIAETLKPYYEGTLQVFVKGSNEIDDMFRYFVAESRKKEQRLVFSQYPDVCEIFEKNYLDGEALEELISCLRDMKSSDFTTIKNSLACLRRLQEKAFIALNRIDSGIVPDKFMVPDNFRGSKIQVRGICKHLRERGYIEHHSLIDRFALTLYGITSDNGSHTPYENPDFRPTKYTVQAMTFMMLDLLLWVKRIEETNLRVT